MFLVFSLLFLREGGGCTQAMMLLPLKTLNVICAFGSVFCYSLTVVFVVCPVILSLSVLKVGRTVPVTVNNDLVVLKIRLNCQINLRKISRIIGLK